MTSSQRSGFDPPADLSPEQLEALAEIADRWMTGQKLVRFAFRATVAIGAIAAAVTAVMSALHDTIWVHR